MPSAACDHAGKQHETLREEAAAAHLARGESVVKDADASRLPSDPKTWELAHVLKFLEQLRPTLKDRTDQYKRVFSDNDIDGVILLGLTTDKLEKARRCGKCALDVCRGN